MKCRETLFVRSVTILLIVCASGSAIAESEWPPFAEDMRQHVRTYKHTFESLEARMNRESFVAIEAGALWEVRGTRRVNGNREYEDIEDAFSWLDELVPLRVGSVNNWRDSYYFSFAKPIVAGETEFDVTFIHSTGTRLPECSSSFAITDCGTCGDTLSDEWVITYTWIPTGFTDSVMQGQDPSDPEASFSTLSDAMDACRAEGISKMNTAYPEEQTSAE